VHADAWLDAGWQQVEFDLNRKYVVSRKIGEHWAEESGVLASLLPTTRVPIYDLLKLANVSVEDWHRTTSGRPVKQYKSNPHYCYNWCFGSPDEGYVLSLWHGRFAEMDSVVIAAENSRASAEQLQAVADDPGVVAARRSRAGEQAERARAVDVAVRESYRTGHPVRVIINLGKSRTREEADKDSEGQADRGRCQVFRGESDKRGRGTLNRYPRFD